VISGNADAGLWMHTGGNATMRDCEISGNDAGVLAHDQGQGTFTGNTLTGNANGAWEI
jgi:parallel beta-helix repeat protein